jgi:predicted Zn-dependent protease
LDPIFRQVDRLNQYDPNQDYLTQTEIALNYRLNHEPHPSVQWRYGVILANVLQQDPKPLIAHLETLIQQDPSNPYFSAYLAFVYLYNWQPHDAERALQPALILAKNVPEIQGLKAIAALMQGNIIKAWDIGAPLLKKS